MTIENPQWVNSRASSGVIRVESMGEGVSAFAIMKHIVRDAATLRIIEGNNSPAFRVQVNLSPKYSQAT